MLSPTGTRAPEQERHNCMAGNCKQGTNGKDGLDGVLVGRGWYGLTLALARTGAPPWDPEQERHLWILRGGALCEVVAGTNFVGASRMQSICVREVKQYK